MSLVKEITDKLNIVGLVLVVAYLLAIVFNWPSVNIIGGLMWACFVPVMAYRTYIYAVSRLYFQMVLEAVFVVVGIYFFFLHVNH